MARRLEITVPDELWDAIERARGLVPRAAWVKRACEVALGPSPLSEGLQGQGSSRAPVDREDRAAVIARLKADALSAQVAIDRAAAFRAATQGPR